MPIRRPGTTVSEVAAMAGDHGLRSSRPGLKKPRQEKVEVPGDRGRSGGSHRGEEGGRGSSAAAVRAKEKTADPGDLRLRLLWPLLRSANAKKRRGGSRVCGGRLGCYL